MEMLKNRTAIVFISHVLGNLYNAKHSGLKYKLTNKASKNNLPKQHMNEEKKNYETIKMYSYIYIRVIDIRNKNKKKKKTANMNG